jgi:hypothetical protein
MIMRMMINDDDNDDYDDNDDVNDNDIMIMIVIVDCQIDCLSPLSSDYSTSISSITSQVESLNFNDSTGSNVFT